MYLCKFYISGKPSCMAAFFRKVLCCIIIFLLFEKHVLILDCILNTINSLFQLFKSWLQSSLYLKTYLGMVHNICRNLKKKREPINYNSTIYLFYCSCSDVQILLITLNFLYFRPPPKYLKMCFLLFIKISLVLY